MYLQYLNSKCTDKCTFDDKFNRYSSASIRTTLVQNWLTNSFIFFSFFYSRGWPIISFSQWDPGSSVMDIMPRYHQIKHEIKTESSVFSKDLLHRLIADNTFPQKFSDVSSMHFWSKEKMELHRIDDSSPISRVGKLIHILNKWMN